MQIQSYTCPNCGAALNIEDETITLVYCSHCGAKLHISYGDEGAKGPRLRPFKSPEGIVLAAADLPEDWFLSGSLVQKWQCDFVPFTAALAAVSPDGTIQLFSTSKECYEDHRIPFVRQQIAQMPGQIQSGFRDFIEPEVYLTQYAQSLAQANLTPVASATLPSEYGRDPQGATARHLAFFRAHNVNITVRIEPANATCRGMLVKYTGQQANGRSVVVLAGMDYEGVEYYDANNVYQQTQAMMNPLGGLGALGALFGGLGGLGNLGGGRPGFGAGQPQAAPQPARPMPADGQIPFGHAQEYGRRVDCIQWGTARSYAAIMPAEKEAEGTQAFLKMVSTLVPDAALEQQFSNLVEQMLQQRTMEAQGMAMQAQQARINLMQSQQNLQRTLARNSQEISAGIMDSWERRNASQDRISHNWSEAIMGVNTYTGLDGRPVQVSVVADHVYQNPYGETFGVSGSALDPELANRIDWTEIHK